MVWLTIQNNLIKWKKIRVANMKETIDREFTRDALADHLTALAEQLKKGGLVMDKRTWTVPDNLGVKIRIKEKKGRISYRLSCRWSTLADYGIAERDTVDQWKQSMKSVKKELSAAFKKVNKDVKASGLPSKATLEQLNASSNAMQRLADPEWSDGMDIYMDHLKNLNHACASGQKEVVLHEVSDLRNCMRLCHKEFK